MIAPEEWYQYQQQYQKYGLEMKPQESREHRDKRRQAAKAARLAAGLDISVARDRRLWLILLAVVTVTMIFVIVLTAYAASVRYDISQVQAENNQLWDEIKNLQSHETTMNGVGYVEQKAKKELGMVAAGTQTCVYISMDDVPAEGFADVLKAKAYQ